MLPNFPPSPSLYRFSLTALLLDALLSSGRGGGAATRVYFWSAQRSNTSPRFTDLHAFLALDVSLPLSRGTTLWDDSRCQWSAGGCGVWKSSLSWLKTCPMHCAHQIAHAHLSAVRCTSSSCVTGHFSLGPARRNDVSGETRVCWK